MAFQSNVFIRIASRVDYHCEMCGVYVGKVPVNKRSAPFHGHSANALHLVQLLDDRSKCVVTGPPDDFGGMRGTVFDLASFKVFEIERPRLLDTDPLDDGYCLCHGCHVGIHTIALNETRLVSPRYTGRNSSFEILEAVTIYYVGRHRF